MVDANDPEQSEAIVVGAEQTLIRVANKIDKCAASAGRGADADDTIYISAKSGEGVDELRRQLRATIDTERIYAGETVISNGRHYEALERASRALQQARRALDDGLSGELLSEELREILHHLGEITGEVTSQDILTNIFSKFCIGK